MARQFYIRTFGCQMNEHDSERIAADLSSDGMERTEDPESADVIVLNTCCIRENADQKFYGYLGSLQELRETKPELQIAVGGCLVQKDRDAILQRGPKVDAVFGTHNISRASALLQRARETGRSVIEVLDAPRDDDDPFPTALPIRSGLDYAAWVTIQVGCDNSCAFCIVPSVRGPEQSKPFGALVSEIEGLADKGAVEVTLLGQNVNSYGRDLTTSLRLNPIDHTDAVALAGNRWVADRPSARPLFGDLLRAVGAIEGIRRVRFTSPHPKDLRPETIAAMAETDAVCEHLHLPLQSGSNRILREMRRGYTAERYLERLGAARAAIDDLAVTTDIIVGFPGETEEEFEETLEVVAAAEYDSAYTFIFSPRPGTRAALLEDQFISSDVIAERFERLKVVCERSALQKNQARIGRTEEVLVEGPSRKDPDVLTGRTRQNKLVHFVGPQSELVASDFAMVTITTAKPYHLLGDFVSAKSTATVSASH